MAASPTHNGWRWDSANSRLDFYYRGTRVGHYTATTLAGALALAAGTTLTAGTGLTVTTGNTTNTAGDEQITAGNLRLGAVETFLTTEPTSAAVMKLGTPPAGTITTSAGVFVTAGGATLSKIVAGGTVNTIQT